MTPIHPEYVKGLRAAAALLQRLGCEPLSVLAVAAAADACDAEISAPETPAEPTETD